MNVPEFEYGRTIINWAKEGLVCGKRAIIFKEKDEDSYCHIIPHSERGNLYSDWPAAVLVLMHNISLDSKNNEKEYVKNSAKINDNLFFKIYYEFEDKVVGWFQDEKNSTLWETDNLGIPEHFQKLKGNHFIVYKNTLEDNYEISKQEEHVLSYDEAKKVMEDNDDWYFTDILLRHFNHSLVLDDNGTLRFQTQPLSEKEKKIGEGLNEAWGEYYSGKYSMRDMILYYMKSGMSNSGFFDVWNESFCTEVVYSEENEDEYTGGEPFSEEQIIKLLEDKPNV